MVKILHWLGIAACIALIVSCFMPWAYFADLNQTFNGFYSYQNEYGKPGKFLVGMGTIALVFILLPKVWAKRANLFVCSLLLAYAIKTYILYGSCYNNYCPEKLFWVYIMLFMPFIILMAAVFPNVKMGEEN